MSDVRDCRGAPLPDPASGTEIDRPVPTQSFHDVPAGLASRRLGHYEIVEMLGEGGMGAVYRAYHVNLKRQVALKTLREGKDADPERIARLYREMEAVGRIDHPNIVRATDAGVFDGVHCLVMELLEGADLAVLLRHHRRLPVDAACEAGRQAAAGLSAIGRHRLVHRDIKPSNLFVTTEGQVKILDLGLAHVGLCEPLTGTGEAFGTADYVSPEQALGDRSLDIRADVYSLGCTLYKALAGTAPFESGRHGSAMSKMYAHVHERPRPVRELRSDVPEQLDALLQSCLRKDPGRRPDPDELAARLGELTSAESRSRLAGLLPRDAGKRALDTDREHGLPARVACELVPTSVVSRPPTSGGETTVRERRSWPRPWTAVGSLCAGAVLVAALVWLGLRGDVHGPIPPGEEPVLVPAPEPSQDSVPGVVREVRWQGTREISDWQVLSGTNSLRLYTDALGMVSIGSAGRPDFRFSLDISQPGQAGGVGVFFDYRVNPATGGWQYRRIGLTSRGMDGFVLIHTLERVDKEGKPDGGYTLAVVHVDVKRQNHLVCDIRGGRLEAAEWNGRALPELVPVDDEIEKAAADPTALGEIGVYCNRSVAIFSALRVDDRYLVLRGPHSP